LSKLAERSARLQVLSARQVEVQHDLSESEIFLFAVHFSQTSSSNVVSLRRWLPRRQHPVRIGGLTRGHTDKIISPHAKKRFGMTSLGAILQTLGLILVVVEDPAARDRTLARRTRFDANNRRLGNKNHLGKQPQIESLEPAQIEAPKPPQGRTGFTRAFARGSAAPQGRKMGRGALATDKEHAMRKMFTARIVLAAIVGANVSAFAQGGMGPGPGMARSPGGGTVPLAVDAVGTE
jgi:hypothetical protein